jgi:hypothetical protein
MPMSQALGSDVVIQAAAELGYNTSLTSPATSTDAGVLQLIALLEALIDDLARDYNWPVLHALHSFTTVNGTAAYDVPTDFLRLVDETAWNATDDIPLLGPVNAKQWRTIQEVAAGLTTEFTFRLYGGQIHLAPTPGATVKTINFEYITNLYSTDDGVAAYPDEQEPLEYVYFDKRLLVEGLKHYWNEAKGFDTTASRYKFEKALSRALTQDGATRVLSLNGGFGDRALDEGNAPETGFGS